MFKLFVRSSLLLSSLVLGLGLSACSSGGGGDGQGNNLGNNGNNGNGNGSQIGGACATDNDCAGTLECITDLAGGYCSAECSDTVACPGGATCVGTFCGDTCSADSDCRTGYRCDPDDRVCFPTPTQTVGQSCGGGDGLCLDDLVCLLETEDEARCRTSCDPATGTGCGATEECVELQGGTGACLPAPTQQVGDTCGSADERCVDGLICLIESDDLARCRTSCDPNAAGGCGGAEECVELQGGSGACVPAATQQKGQACSGLEMRCVDGLACIPLTENESQCFETCEALNDACEDANDECSELTDDLSICLAPGARQAGETCQGFTERCVESLVCVGFGGDGPGLCLANCDLNGDGADCTGECIELNSGDGACLTPGTQGVGEGCSVPEMRCVDDAICIADEEDGPSTCRANCDVCQDPATVCGNSLECIALNGDTGVCVPPRGNVALGMGCDDMNACAPGLVCFQGNCEKICNTMCMPNGCTEAATSCQAANEDTTLGLCVPAGG